MMSRLAAVVHDQVEGAGTAADPFDHAGIGLIPYFDADSLCLLTHAVRIDVEPEDSGLREVLLPHAERGAIPDANLENADRLVPKPSQIDLVDIEVVQTGCAVVHALVGSVFDTEGAEIAAEGRLIPQLVLAKRQSHSSHVARFAGSKQPRGAPERASTLRLQR